MLGIKEIMCVVETLTVAGRSQDYDIIKMLVSVFHPPCSDTKILILSINTYTVVSMN